jgi:glycosyltransferase involved in cell wall biosynthesis
VRVLIVIDDLRRAGAQRVITQEVRALHPQHVDFHVVALARVPRPSFESDLTRLGVGVTYVAGSGLIDPRRIDALRRVIARIEPDLVHTHLTYANILGAPAATLVGRPIVASLHNVDTNQTRFAHVKRCLEGRILRRWATRIVVVCAATRQPISRNFDVPIQRTVVVPNGVAPSSIRLPRRFDRMRKRRELGAADHEQLVCTVARLEPSKGHRFLLDALGMLQSRGELGNLRLVLVGTGPEASRIRALAQGLGLADRVALLGVRLDVHQIMAASDLFVLPSLNEGLSQALLEATALGTPVVATDVGGTPDVVEPGRTGWCVPPAQPAVLAEAITDALASPSRAAEYAEAARDLVRGRFTLSAHIDQLLGVYGAVAGTQRPGAAGG